MAASMRRVVTNFTDIVFPQGNVTVDRQQLHLQKPGNELVSSLPWQMSLYFNVYFFPIWLVTNLITFYLKFHYLDMLYQIILITIFITITAVEIIRLYLGYLGNLCEKV
ncbi:PREDICTED: transmembrane protein 17-like [Priapulus caudatus]|uniref:Transmembrane protein 17-like n=1 Tax=Priapulus caudatus TaxID=37621 RepID=A0ABM1F0C0_PRICU|nr:PREDICTED: transmembrane protein 17-like [Priapulus caudatus]